MATLTYDSTPADQPEFNEAEQEALQIGEQAAADQHSCLQVSSKMQKHWNKLTLNFKVNLVNLVKTQAEAEPVEEEAQEDLQEEPEDGTLTESEAQELN